MPYAVDIAMDHSANGDGDVPRFGLVKARPHNRTLGTHFTRPPPQRKRDGPMSCCAKLYPSSD